MGIGRDFAETTVGLTVLVGWLLAVLASIGIPVALVYMAFHFARKFW